MLLLGWGTGVGWIEWSWVHRILGVATHALLLLVFVRVDVCMYVWFGVYLSYH